MVLLEPRLKRRLWLWRFDMILPLAGVVIADFTRVLTGPFCTQTLGDFGADVIKIEPLSGDDTRAWGAPWLENGDKREATYFLSTNRHKRSIALDLKNPSDLEIAQRIVDKSDVLVENFRPDTLERLGLVLEHPRLIACSISGFGSSGALKDWAGYDLIAQGMSGFMSYTGEPSGVPLKAGVAVADIFAGSLATQAILAALFERERTGRGRKVEVNLLESMIALGSYQVSRFLNAGESAERLGNEHRSIVPYGTFRTSDGFVNIAAGNDVLFQKLCWALEATDLLEPRFATNEHRLTLRLELTTRLEAHLMRFSSQSAIERLQSAGVPCGAVWSVQEALESDWATSRGVVQSIDHPDLGEVRLTAPPFEFDGQTLPVRSAPPSLNQHRTEILKWLEE
jgi:crotonobetainyl-CoA:carnitine CoA-transferase CaiB-like acyl-CoA transferase